MSGFQLRHLGVVMEPQPGNPQEIEEERQEREFLRGGAEPSEDLKASHTPHKHP